MKTPPYPTRIQLVTSGLCVVLLLVSQFVWSEPPDPQHEKEPSADTDAPPVFVDEATVTAPFRATSETPITHTDLDARDISRMHFGQEPSMLLAGTPSISYYTDSGGIAGYSYLRLRGIDQTRINFTLDGVPLNEPEDQGVYFSNYPDFFTSVRTIQIQRGVGTSANGVASFAGSVLFESPPLFSGADSVAASAGYGSFDSKRIYGEVTTSLGNNGGLYLRASHLASDGFKHHSNNQGSSLFYSSGWASGPHILKLSGFVGHQENQLAWLGVPMDLIAEDPKTNGNTQEERDEFSQSLTMLQFSTAASRRTTVTSSLYFNYLDGNYDFDLFNFLGLPPNGELYNYDFRSHLLGGFINASFSTDTLEIHGGLHANRYDRRHRGSERTIGGLYENTGFKDELAAFIKVTSSFGMLRLFGDLQVRETSFEYQGSVAMPTLTWRFVNPRIGASYLLADGASVYYTVGRTGREPTRNDLFGGWDDLPADDDGNPLLLDIPPEEVVDHEIGVSAGRGSWQVSANLYYMDFEDEIALNGQFGPNGLPLHSNVATSYRAGLEVEAAVMLTPSLRWAASSAFSRNRVREAGVEFEPVFTPDVMINQELLYGRGRVSLSLTGRYQSGSWIDFANTIELPSFAVFDAAASYRIGAWQLELRILNLTDNHNFTYGSIRADGVPLYFIQAPRSLFAAVRWAH